MPRPRSATPSASHDAASTARLILDLFTESGAVLAAQARRMRADVLLAVEIEDILQDFALWLHGKDAGPIRAYEGKAGARFTTYITVVFRNWLLRRLPRSGGGTISLDEVDESDPAFTERLDFAELLHGKELEATLIKCIAALEEPERTYLSRKTSGQSIAEIARDGGENVNTVYRRFYTALGRLKDCLRKAGYQAE